MVSPMVPERASWDVEMNTSPISRNRRRKNANNQKKVRIAGNNEEPSTSKVNGENTTDDVNTEAEFTEVRKPMRRTKKKTNYDIRCNERR